MKHLFLILTVCLSLFAQADQIQVPKAKGSTLYDEVTGTVLPNNKTGLDTISVLRDSNGDFYSNANPVPVVLASTTGVFAYDFGTTPAALRVAAILGNVNGQIDYGMGNVSNQTIRTVIAQNQFSLLGQDSTLQNINSNLISFSSENDTNLENINQNVQDVEAALSHVNDSLDAIEADADSSRVTLESIDADIDVPLSTRASEATLSNLNSKVVTVDTDNVTVVSSALPTGAATADNQTNGAQKSQLVDGAGDIADIVPLSTQITDTDKGVVTNTVIHGRTTGGGGGFVDVKVNPSGALTVEANVTSSVLPTGAATEATQLNNRTELQAINTELDNVTSELVSVNSELNNVSGLLTDANTSLDNIEADADATRIATQSIDTDFDTALSTRASSVNQTNGLQKTQLVNAAGANLDMGDGSSGAATIRTSANIRFDGSSPSLNAGTTNATTLRTSANITRNGTELSYNHGVADANTLRTVAIQQDASGDLPDAGPVTSDDLDGAIIGWFGNSRNYIFDGTNWDRMRSGFGTVTQGLRVNAIPGNASGIADFGPGVSGGQTPRVVIATNQTTIPVHDTVNTSLVSARVTVGTTQVEAKVGGSPLTNRKFITIYNDSSVVLYYGPTGVTTSGLTKGEPLFPNQSVSIPVGPSISVFVITTVAGQAFIVKEAS